MTAIGSLPPDIDFGTLIQMPYHRESIYDQLLDGTPWPHLVHYQKNRVIYVPPSEFLMWRPTGPSDCTWIVPGTGGGIR